MASLVVECVHVGCLPRLIQPASDPGSNGEPRIVVIRILDSVAEQISPARPASPRERREWLESEDAFARSTSLDTISGAS